MTEAIDPGATLVPMPEDSVMAGDSGPYRSEDQYCSIACGGHCCRSFNLPYSPVEMGRKRQRLADDQEIQTITGMLIYQGHGKESPLGPDAAHSSSFDDYWYTCKNLDTETNRCTAYGTRPRMCSEFPYGRTCPYPKCGHPSGGLETGPFLIAKSDEKICDDLEKICDDLERAIDNIPSKEGIPL